MKEIRCGALIFIFFCSLYSLFSIGHYGGDGYEDYLTAKSIVLNHSLAFNEKNQDIDEFNYKKNLGFRGKDGKLYNPRGGLIMPLILSAFYFLGHISAGFFKSIPHDFITMFFVSFSNPVISAVNCLLIFAIARNLLFSARISLALTFIYGLTTMAPVYVRTGFAEPALTMFLLLSLHLLFKYKRSCNKIYLALAGAALSLSLFTKAVPVIFLPIIVLYAMWIIFEKRRDATDRLRDAASYLLPLSVILLFVGVFNYHIYGGFLRFGSRELIGETDRVIKSSHFFKGLYYYLLSTGKGLFIFNITSILSFFGLTKVSEGRKKEALLFALLFLSNLIFFAMSFKRGSLFAWGPRYLFPSAAALVLLIGEFIENNRNFKGRLLVLALSVIGFFVMLPCMFINQSKFYFFVKGKLGLPEYMINFIPDLSPVMGAWKMLYSRLIFITKGTDMPFIYNPDYRLVSPVSASMSEYNNFDFWFLKVISIKPEYYPLVFGLAVFMAMIALSSVVFIFRFAISKPSSRK